MDHRLGTAQRAVNAGLMLIRSETPTDLDPEDLPGWFDLRDWLREVQRLAGEIGGHIDEALIGAVPPGDHLDVDGRRFRRTAAPKRSGWNAEALLRDVLDSRVADSNGEPVEETPIAKVLAVWALGAPRLGALRARRLDPEDYCRVSFGPKHLTEIIDTPDTGDQNDE